MCLASGWGWIIWFLAPLVSSGCNILVTSKTQANNCPLGLLHCCEFSWRMIIPKMQILIERAGRENIVTTETRQLLENVLDVIIEKGDQYPLLNCRVKSAFLVISSVGNSKESDKRNNTFDVGEWFSDWFEFSNITSLKKSLLKKFSFDILAIHIRSHTISSKHDSLNWSLKN